MSFGNFFESGMLNLLYGAETFPPPDKYYLGLSLGDPLDDGSGIIEPSHESYHRLEVDNDDVTWAAATGGSKTTLIDLEWPLPTAEWGLVGWVFFSTAAVGGSFCFYRPISVQYVGINSKFRVSAGNLTISLAGGASLYMRNAILDHLFGADPFVPPATVYLGHSQTDPAIAVTEPSGVNYSRIAISNNTTNFPHVTGDTKTNGATFQTAIASGSWGMLQYFFTADDPTAGNVLHSGELDDPLYPGVGNSIVWDVGALSVQLQ